MSTVVDPPPGLEGRIVTDVLPRSDRQIITNHLTNIVNAFSVQDRMWTIGGHVPAKFSQCFEALILALGIPFSENDPDVLLLHGWGNGQVDMGRASSQLEAHKHFVWIVSRDSEIWRDSCFNKFLEESKEVLSSVTLWTPKSGPITIITSLSSLSSLTQLSSSDWWDHRAVCQVILETIIAQQTLAEDVFVVGDLGEGSGDLVHRKRLGLHAALRRLHVNTGHASVPEMIRLLEHAGGSKEAISTCRHFSCSICEGRKVSGTVVGGIGWKKGERGEQVQYQPRS